MLPLAEFAYNNANNKSTGFSPFFANKGYHPALAVEPGLTVPSVGAQQYVAELDELHEELKQNIALSQLCYQKYADHHRSPAPTFKIGD